MSSSNKYQRVTGEDVPLEAEVELQAVLAPVVAAAEAAPYVVKVMYKESAATVTCLSEGSTVLQLKNAIVPEFSIPVERQRFIFAGRQLKPDDQTLGSFRVFSGASVHLFPLPAPAPPVATAVPAGPGAILNPLQTAVAAGPADALQSPVHFDPLVSQTSREVKLWCLVLLFLSAMTLFNNLSYMSSTGKLGAGTLDSVVTVVDTLCSAAGVLVANLGITSLRTLELEDLRKYVQALGALAVCCMLMRVAWVVDVVLQVQRAVDKAQHSAAADTPPDTGNTAGDDAQPTNAKLDSRLVVNFTIQACIVAAICIFAWASCVMRARRLQTAVRNFREAMPV